MTYCSVQYGGRFQSNNTIETTAEIMLNFKQHKNQKVLSERDYSQQRIN